MLAEVHPGTDGEASRRRREGPRAVAPVGRRAGVSNFNGEGQREPAAGRVAADARPRRAELENALVGRAHVVQSVRTARVGRPPEVGHHDDAARRERESES